MHITTPIEGIEYYLPVQDTLCQGLVPLAFAEDDTPILYDTESGAEREIADHISCLCGRVMDTFDDYDLGQLYADIEDVSVIPVTYRDGILWLATTPIWRFRDRERSEMGDF